VPVYAHTSHASAYLIGRIQGVLRLTEKVRKVELLGLIFSDATPVPASRKVQIDSASRGRVCDIICLGRSNHLVTHPLMNLFNHVSIHHLVNIILLVGMLVSSLGVSMLKFTLLKAYGNN
jgi:hypothetical protein